MIEIQKKEELEDEPKIEFKAISDKAAFIVKSSDQKTQLVEISGYDLQINFNMQYMKTSIDVDEAVSGISEMFRSIITDKLLQGKQSE